MVLLRVVPLAYLALCVGIAVLLHVLVPGTRVLAAPWNLLGVVPVALGVVVAGAAVVSLKRHGTTVKPLRKPKALVATGVFRLSRNPVYLGFVLVLLGAVALLGSLTPWLIVPAFAVFTDALFVRFEERRLEEVFGESWAEYKSRVRRWL